MDRVKDKHEFHARINTMNKQLSATGKDMVKKEEL